MFLSSKKLSGGKILKHRNVRIGKSFVLQIDYLLFWVFRFRFRHTHTDTHTTLHKPPFTTTAHWPSSSTQLSLVRGQSSGSPLPGHAAVKAEANWSLLSIVQGLASWHVRVKPAFQNDSYVWRVSFSLLSFFPPLSWLERDLPWWAKCGSILALDPGLGPRLTVLAVHPPYLYI